MKIEVLGPGCPRCFMTMHVVMQALKEMKLNAEVEHVSDLATIISYGVFYTPGLVINGKVKSMGRIPSLDEVKRALREEVRRKK